MSNAIKIGRPAQFDLFAIRDDENQTNTIDLWDSAPRWLVRERDDLRDGNSLKIIERTFTHDGKLYKLTMAPARVKRGEREFDAYPGEREELVEMVIRRAAARRNRLSLEGKEDVGALFTIYELREELSRLGHTFNHYEVLDALTILHRSTVEITRIDEDGKERLVSGACFPQLRLSDKKDEHSQSYVQFNWMVSHAIKLLAFQQIDYDDLMSQRGQIERWMYRRLHRLYRENSVCMLQASDVIEGLGLAHRKRLRDTLRRIAEGVFSLKVGNVVADYEAVDIRHGRAKVDVLFKITLTQSFVDKIMEARRRAEQNRIDYLEATGREATEFLPASPVAAAKLRAIKGGRV